MILMSISQEFVFRIKLNKIHIKQFEPFKPLFANNNHRKHFLYSVSTGIQITTA